MSNCTSKVSGSIPDGITRIETRSLEDRRTLSNVDQAIYNEQERMMGSHNVELAEEILRLKRQRGAIMLAHN